MATTKRVKTAKDLLDDNKIIALYMNDVLNKNAEANNVFLFCKDNAIEESDFYAFFGSFDSVKQAIWVKFFENAKGRKSFPSCSSIVNIGRNDTAITKIALNKPGPSSLQASKESSL